MKKQIIIDIDAEFEGLEFDEVAIRHATGMAKRSSNPDWHKNRSASIRKAMQQPEIKEKQRRSQQEKYDDPEYRKRIAENNRQVAQTKEWKEAHTEGMQKREANGWREKNYEKNMKMVQTPEWKESRKKAGRTYSESGRAYINNRKIIEERQQNPEYFVKLKEGIAKRTQDPEWQKRNTEAALRRRKSVVTPDGIFPYAKDAFVFYAEKRNITIHTAEGWLKRMRDTYPKEYYTISQEEYMMLTGKDIL